MGWSWDHNQTGGTRSYSAHTELGEYLKQIAPRSDWAAISPLFNRGSGDTFDIQPDQAARMGAAFKALTPFASPTWQQACYELGAAAAEAARTRSVWHWS
ncbi:hypothetical protein ACGFZP_13125 [Kitasatospora sp. NPDC048239]|uniref:DUF7739 domain-containing protein n=1 Tax=Kitasatospora sp. NPDC048239 TaxID=3364046 RepID=UPI00371E3547